MAQPAQRVFAFVIALLFLVTTVAFSGYVIWEATRGQEESDASQEALDAAQDAATNQQGDNMLQGTKLENFEPIGSVGELQIIDLQEGTGEVVPEGATVTAHYTGALAKDGTIFQSSQDFGEPIAFSLGQVIEGWQKGVPGMKVGGKRRLIIPAAQAYGSQEQSDIPANSDLVFDIGVTKLGE